MTGVNLSQQDLPELNMIENLTGSILDLGETAWMKASCIPESLPNHPDIKEAEFELEGTKVKAAFVNNLGSARKLLDQVKKGESPYHLVEVTACSGGCFNEKGMFSEAIEPNNYFDHLYNKVFEYISADQINSYYRKK